MNSPSASPDQNATTEPDALTCGRLRELDETTLNRLWWLGITSSFRSEAFSRTKLQAAAAIMRAVRDPEPIWGLFLLAVVREDDTERMQANQRAVIEHFGRGLESDTSAVNEPCCWLYVLREEASGRRLLVELMDDYAASDPHSIRSIRILPSRCYEPRATPPEGVDLQLIGVRQPVLVETGPHEQAADQEMATV